MTDSSIVYARLPADTAAQLRQMAHDNASTISSTIARAVERHLRNQQAVTPELEKR